MTPDDPSRHSLARSFGDVADAYQRVRPGYPDDLVAWAVGREPMVVLELGAGTGRCTEVLRRLGHDVHAVDHDGRMLALLAERLPEVRTSIAGAEDIPLPDRSVDVVVCAQSLHWFDLPRALPEIARVLRRDGHLAMLWNRRDTGVPWVRRLERLIRPDAEPDQSVVDVLGPYAEFGWVEERSARHWQDVDRRGLLDLAATLSPVAVLAPDERGEVLGRVAALWDDLDRLSLRLPYVCEAYRATVRHAEPDPPPPQDDVPPEDDGTLLIDFR